MGPASGESRVPSIDGCPYLVAGAAKPQIDLARYIIRETRSDVVAARSVMKSTIAPLLALLAATLVSSCVVRPAPVRYVETAPPPPSQYADEDEYVPPEEYVVDGPVYFDTMPGITFYPIYIDAPGSCYCVVAMRFYRGVWLGVDNRVIYRGQFSFRPAPPQHRAEWHRHGGVVHGMRPIRGTFVHQGGRLRPMPPPDTRHHQVIMQRPAHRDARPAPTRPPEQSPGARPQSDNRSAPAEANRRPGQPDIRDNRDGRDGRDNRDARDSRDSRDTRDGRDNRDNRNGRDGRDNRDNRDGRDGRDGRSQFEPSRDGLRPMQVIAPASAPASQPGPASSPTPARERSRDQSEQPARVASPPENRSPQAESRRDARPVAVREYPQSPQAQPRPTQTAAPMQQQSAPQAQGQPAQKERPREQAKQGAPKKCTDAERNDKKC
jgi:hypothetical protein